MIDVNATHESICNGILRYVAQRGYWASAVAAVALSIALSNLCTALHALVVYQVLTPRLPGARRRRSRRILFGLLFCRRGSTRGDLCK